MQILTKVPKINNLVTDNNSPKGIFWDMDGTLCNTEEIHANALLEILKSNHPEQEFSTERLQKEGIGLTDSMVFDYYQKKGLLKTLSLTQFLERKNTTFINLLKEVQLESIFKPSVLKLLKEISKSKIKLALVTSSEKIVTYNILDKLKIRDLFDCIITKDDTDKNKPNPAPYMRALKDLSLLPEEALIFEDSKVGIKAAQRAQIKYYQVKWY